MGETVSGIIQKQLGANAPGAEKLQQSQNGRSFESVLQKGNQQSAPNAETQGANQTGKIDDPKMEAMRVDLMKRYQKIPEGMPKVTAIFPEFIDTKTRMSSFRSLLDKAIDNVGASQRATDVKGRFAQVENEWLQLENVMRSDKELTQGEMLGLQARLYQVSQHIDVLSKVVDQMTSGVKTILNTNV